MRNLIYPAKVQNKIGKDFGIIIFKNIKQCTQEIMIVCTKVKKNCNSFTCVKTINGKRLFIDLIFEDCFKYISILKSSTLLKFIY